MELDSLWIRFMKARYFPHSSFLEAKKRVEPRGLGQVFLTGVRFFCVVLIGR